MTDDTIDQSDVNKDLESKNPVISIRFKDLKKKNRTDKIIKALVKKGIAKTPSDALFEICTHFEKCLLTPKL